MKTIQQHLNTIKEPYRTKAINNVSNKNLKKECLCLSYAILDGFEWSKSSEGTEY